MMIYRLDGGANDSLGCGAVKNTAVALGRFDAIHIGHMRIIKKTVEYARKHSLIVEPYEAYWEKYGQEAAYHSNYEKLGKADALIAFWDGKGRMTGALIDAAKAKGIKVAVVLY